MKIPKPFSHPSPEALRSFREAVSRLKKEGLIPPNSRGKIVNIKNARPGDSYGGMTLRDRIKAYPDVARGEAVTLAKSRIKDTQGFKIASKGLDSKRVIVPLQGDAKVYVENGNIIRRHQLAQGSVTRTMLPRKDLKDYLTEAKQLPDLKGRQWYAFYAYNGKSKKVFRTAAQLRAYIRKYNAFKKVTSKSQRDFFRTFEIVKINDPKDWIENRGSGRKAKRQSEPYAVRRARFNKLPEALKQTERNRRAEYERKRRKKGK